MADKRFPVTEIFGPTLQGEGPEAGVKQHFVRFGYCDGAGQGWCTWCDTMDAVDPKNSGSWRQMTVEQILQELAALPPAGWVSITGGNPAIHSLNPLLYPLTKAGYKINIETQGTIPRPWFNGCDLVTLSPKPPSAGSVFTEAMWDKLRACLIVGTRCVMKVVVDPNSDADFQFAKEVHRRHPKVPFYFSVLTDGSIDAEQFLIMSWRKLAQKVLDDTTLRNVAVLPQLHVLLWGHTKGV